MGHVHVLKLALDAVQQPMEAEEAASTGKTHPHGHVITVVHVGTRDQRVDADLVGRGQGGNMSQVAFHLVDVRQSSTRGRQLPGARLDFLFEAAFVGLDVGQFAQGPGVFGMCGGQAGGLAEGTVNQQGDADDGRRHRDSRAYRVDHAKFQSANLQVRHLTIRKPA